MDESGLYLIGSSTGEFNDNPNQGLYDAIVVKYNFDGDQIWVKQLGSAANDFLTDVSIQGGNAFVTGTTYGIFQGGSEEVRFDTDGFFSKIGLSSMSEVKYLSICVQGINNTVNQFAHGLSHQLGLVDLDPYPNVSFPIEHIAERWDNMAKPFEGAHPLVWSKEHATWLTFNNGKIYYIPRPRRGTSPRISQPPIHLNYQSIIANDQYGAIAIGLTEGVTSFEEETHFYWIEARSPMLGSDPVPSKGVIVYYANKRIPQGQVPVIIRDHTIGSSGNLNDAVIPVRESETPRGTGIRITVIEERPGTEGYDVSIDYDPPRTDYDVNIRRGDPPWTSPDIWIDNRRSGRGYAPYDPVAMKAISGRVEEQPIAGDENRIFARVHNSGPATAHDIEVLFKISAPYHTLGGEVGAEGDFDSLKSIILSEIPAGDYKDVFVTWTPNGLISDPHNCVKVFLRRMTDDNNNSNNDAQQNLTVISSSMASPYEVKDFYFNITNSDTSSQLFYFVADGIPPNWKINFYPDKKLLLPHQQMIGKLTMQPALESPPCSGQEIHVTAWTPKNHTLIRVGGTTVDVQLRKKTNLSLQVDVKKCAEEKKNAGDTNQPGKSCGKINASGCTIPARSYEVITLCYRDPSGNPFYRDITTDANGCFDDFYIAVQDGIWEVNAFYEGDNCSGPSHVDTKVAIPRLQNQ